MAADSEVSGTRGAFVRLLTKHASLNAHLVLIPNAPTGQEMEINMRMFRNIAAAAVVVAGTFAANAAFAYERWIDFVNVSDHGVTDIRIANLDDRRWGPNLLSGVLPAGYHIVVNPMKPQGYCRFDIRLTYTDGTVSQVNDVNLCEALKIVSNGSSYNVYTI